MNASLDGLVLDVLFACLLLSGLIALVTWVIVRLSWREMQRQPAPLRGRPPSQARYRRTPSLLTPTEAHFYRELLSILPAGLSVQCKVRLADLLLSAPGDLQGFRQVSQKHVDFCVCRADGLVPLVCVELDDSSHRQTNRRARDQFVDAAYAQAGLPMVHVPVQHNYNPDFLRELLLPHLPASSIPSSAIFKAAVL